MDKKYWQINTQKLADAIKEIAGKASSEEDLKIKVEPLLQKAFKQMGIDIGIVKYEQSATTFRGRTDAIYGYLIIEYKAPGKLSRKTEINKAERQLQRYLTEQAKTQQKDNPEAFLEKAVGVAIDGKHVIFMRYSKTTAILQTPVPVEKEQRELFTELEAARGFQVLGPYPINGKSLANLLIFARASARRPLTAQKLSEVFSPQSSIAQQAVSELYSVLSKAQRKSAPSKIKSFFTEWDRLFGVVYGQELDKAAKAAEKAASLYGMPGGVRLKPLLFSIHTFYAFLMKLIAIELVALQRESHFESFVQGLAALDDKNLELKLSYLESGGEFIDRGIENFLEADFFSWYLEGWESRLSTVFRNVIRTLSDFEPATPILEPEWTRDLLKELYEAIVPHELRHDLGEYYTPDWLAGYVIDRSGFKGEIGTRFLDPACGSGTFLIQAIHRAIRCAAKKKKKRIPMEELAHHILNNIVGFDLNPLAVLAARTNYLIAFSRFIPFIRPISIPVYLCDSILTPTEYIEEGALPFENTIIFKTTKQDYTFPVSMKQKSHIDKFTYLVDTAINGKLNPSEFNNQIKKQFDLGDQDIQLLVNVYKRIKELDDSKENGIWAKYIKNAFAPAYVGKFDYVIGNPPWIRWGYLSDDYRERTLELWKKYGLFSLKGYAARLGGGEKDFSMLFVYASADNYLKNKGTLGFIITLEVFKSKGAGEGFRTFELKNCSIPLKVFRMEDMVHLKPFTAANKTSIFFLRKGKKTTYPIPVVKWARKSGIGKIPPDWTFEKVKAHTNRERMQAIPIDQAKVSSSWQTAPSDNLSIFSKLKGNNPYKAYRGISSEPYGVFWLRLKEIRPDGLIVTENMHDRGKLKNIKATRSSIEPNLVFPAICGGNIVKFGIKSLFYLLVSQDPKKRCGYDEKYMLQNFPLTFAYLTQFKDILVSRASYKKYFCKEIKEKGKTIEYKPFAPFYSQFNISDLTFSKHRVTWKRMASRITAVVLSSMNTKMGLKPILSTDTTSFIPLAKKNESHYLCAVINSAITNDFIKSFSGAGRGFGAPSVMNNIKIPKFNPLNKIHKKLAELSIKAHNRVKNTQSIEDIEKEINELVKGLWNIK